MYRYWLSLKNTGLINFITVLLVPFYFSCSKPQEKPPIELDKMKLIVADLSIAEEYAKGLFPDSINNKLDKNPDSLATFYASIWKHHQIDREEFQEAFDWYKSHPLLLDSLYALVLTEITEQQVQVTPSTTTTAHDSTSNPANTSVDSSPVKRQRDLLKARRKIFDSTQVSN
jgi:hypothetical protein